MAGIEKDPFTMLREAGVGHDSVYSKPVDQLSISQIDALKDNIKDQYLSYAKGKYTDKTADEVFERWIDLLESAIAGLPKFQRLVLSEELTPGTYNFALLEVQPDWLLGIWLPGFYEHFDNFDDGLDYLQKLAEKAKLRAKKNIATVLRKHASRAIQAAEIDYLNAKAPLAPAHANEYITTLFILAREEKGLNELRGRTLGELNDLSALLPDIDGAQKLHSRYNTVTSQYSLVDRFMHSAIELMTEKFPDLERPSDHPIDTASFQSSLEEIGERVDFLENGVSEYGKNEHVSSEAASPEVEGDEFEGDEYELPELGILAKELVPDEYETAPVYFYPAWHTPKSDPIRFREPRGNEVPLADSQDSQGAVADATTQSTSVLAKFKKSKGFISARMHSNKEEKQLELNINSAEDVLKGALHYLNKSLEGLSSLRPKTKLFDKRGFYDCVSWLAKLDRRLPEADAAEKTDIRFRSFNGFQMADDWIHVRYLLAAIKLNLLQLDSPETKALGEQIDLAEDYLVVVFAAIRSGADDPLPWHLVLEGVLRMIWRQINEKSGSPSILVRNLFNELALWCNGTAINAFVIRLPKSEGKYDDVVENWYKLLFEYDPTCANEDCLRLLIHPDKISGKTFRSMLSVGTREARVGKRAVRSFISTNRDGAYVCLYDALRSCRPSKELIVVLMWYSHLYHDRTCKATRGKFAINAF